MWKKSNITCMVLHKFTCTEKELPQSLRWKWLRTFCTMRWRPNIHSMNTGHRWNTMHVYALDHNSAHTNTHTRHIRTHTVASNATCSPWTMGEPTLKLFSLAWDNTIANNFIVCLSFVSQTQYQLWCSFPVRVLHIWHVLGVEGERNPALARTWINVWLDDFSLISNYGQLHV